MAPQALRSLVTTCVVLLVGTGVASASAASDPAAAAPDQAAAAPDPAEGGSFSRPFADPTIERRASEEACIEHSDHHGDEESHLECKPAAGSMATLADERILYWNALEGTENVTTSTGGEFGALSINDQTRVLDLDGRTWTEPEPVDGGANPDGAEPDELIPGTATEETYNGRRALLLGPDPARKWTGSRRRRNDVLHGIRHRRARGPG